MEIISYVGQGSNNSFNQIHKSTLTLDELLYRQKKLSFQAQQKLDFSELTLNLGILLKNVVFCLKKVRFLLIGILAIGFLVSTTCFVHSLINSVSKPASFDYALDAEIQIMEEAMRNLVLDDATDDYTDDGTLSATTNFTFTNPVSYQEYTVKSG